MIGSGGKIEPARAAGNGRWGNPRWNARHPQRLVDINQWWRAMEDNSLESRAAYFRSVAERLRGIAAGLRYDLRRADQLRALADGFERFAARLEQEAGAEED